MPLYETSLRDGRAYAVERQRYSVRLLKSLMGFVLLVLSLICATAAFASSSVTAVVTANKATMYERPSAFAKTVATLSKGEAVTVTAVRGNWAQVSRGTAKGYMVKSVLKKQADPSEESTGSVTKKQIQARLAQLGYMKSSDVQDKSSSSSVKAVRIFQMMNNLPVSGRLNKATSEKIMSASARKKPAISNKPWSESGINGVFHTRGQATIVDLVTGARMHIRRVGGTSHCDVEPSTAADTAILKKMYGGTFSWDSRAVLLIAGGRCFPAAINGMPHGEQISHTNNYEGQFCLHLRGSLTHGTDKANAAHQANIAKAYEYLTT